MTNLLLYALLSKRRKAMQLTEKMLPIERRAASALALIYFLRMFALFLLLPVLSLYLKDFPDATATLLGVALGIYGLTQAALQIPLGMLSDRWGRKPVILLGLLLFAAGGIMASFATSIWIVICGRALQGMGAIAAAVMALAADLSRESQRTKIMAIIGVSIGAAFLLAFLCGTLLAAQFGIDGVFLCGSILALLAMAVLYLWVPNPTQHIPQAISMSAICQTWQIPGLRRLNISIFMLHMILTANFIVLPIALRDIVGLNIARHWIVYMPVLIASMLLIIPFILLKNRAAKHTDRPLLITIVALIIAQFGLTIWHHNIPQFLLWLSLFFAAFNYMEALFPAQISKIAPKQQRGLALGIYSSSQFIGIFAGGLIGGRLYDVYNIQIVLLACAIGGVLWAAWVAVSLIPKTQR